MLLTREEMAFDFKGAKFDREKDRDLLAWIASQFLFGEVTGIQVGHWIHNAPDLQSARFLARQCLEELQHVDVFMELFRWLGARPVKAHPVIRFLTTEGDDWAEHVALEMAQGEGLVLMMFYVLVECIDDEKVKRKLEAACRQEEGHVAFGEQELIRLLKRRPGLRKRLLGLHLLSLWVVKRFERWISKRADKDHAVLCQIPEYIGRIVEVTDLRLRRMGVTTKPLAEYGRAETFLAISRSLAQKLLRRFRFWRWFQRRRLTSTYLRDPYLQEIMTLAEIQSAAGIPVVKAA